MDKNFRGLYVTGWSKSPHKTLNNDIDDKGELDDAFFAKIPKLLCKTSEPWVASLAYRKQWPILHEKTCYKQWKMYTLIHVSETWDHLYFWSLALGKPQNPILHNQERASGLTKRRFLFTLKLPVYSWVSHRQTTHTIVS